MMMREPVQVPSERGIYALVNKKRRLAYVGYTKNLQKRSHSLSFFLSQQDKSKRAYWPIRNMPKYPSDEFTFVVLAAGCAPDKAPAALKVARLGFEARKYTLVEGSRSSAIAPMVTFEGKQMTLVEAIKRSESRVSYLAAWRRIDRGWTVEQALGLVPPDPRWDTAKQAERRRRAAA